MATGRSGAGRSGCSTGLAEPSGTGRSVSSAGLAELDDATPGVSCMSSLIGATMLCSIHGFFQSLMRM
eukprot:14977744-Heterocapsa_arctica.AAC.1